MQRYTENVTEDEEEEEEEIEQEGEGENEDDEEEETDTKEERYGNVSFLNSSSLRFRTACLTASPVRPLAVRTLGAAEGRSQSTSCYFIH